MTKRQKYKVFLMVLISIPFFYSSFLHAGIYFDRMHEPMHCYGPPPEREYLVPPLAQAKQDESWLGWERYFTPPPVTEFTPGTSGARSWSWGKGKTSDDICEDLYGTGSRAQYVTW